jgi:hypothetical protein
MKRKVEQHEKESPTVRKGEQRNVSEEDNIVT